MYVLLYRKYIRVNNILEGNRKEMNMGSLRSSESKLAYIIIIYYEIIVFIYTHTRIYTFTVSIFTIIIGWRINENHCAVFVIHFKMFTSKFFSIIIYCYNKPFYLQRVCPSLRDNVPVSKYTLSWEIVLSYDKILLLYRYTEWFTSIYILATFSNNIAIIKNLIFKYIKDFFFQEVDIETSIYEMINFFCSKFSSFDVSESK